MIVLDANIAVAAVLGRSVRAALAGLHGRGRDVAIPDTQVQESMRVLIEKIAVPLPRARDDLGRALKGVIPLSTEVYASFEAAARARLAPRAQTDWPVLASALALGADIWTHDYDFFGVGVPVWTARTIAYA